MGSSFGMRSIMGARLKALASSLGIRLLIPLFLTVSGVLAVYAVFSFRSTKEHFLELVSGEAYRSSGLIRRATHDGMLLNRLEEVQSTIERLAEGPEVAGIRVYDKRGTIVLSSKRSEIGQRISVAAPPCTRCHAGGKARGAAVEAADVTRGQGEDVVRQLSVIKNERGCSASGCHEHAASESVLGVLDVQMSMQPLERSLASARRQLIWTTLALMAVIALVAAFIFRRWVHRPIRRLQMGARRIASGDLTTRIQVDGTHELALLARDFNRMGEDLSRTHTELTEWSQKLEEKVVEKTAELRSVQRQVVHMEKMASLGKLAATVAHEINNPLSGVLTYARLVERELAELAMAAEVREELERYLHLMQKECTRCGGIVQNLLLFARRTGSDFVTVDVNDIVDRSLMLIRHHLEMKGIQLDAKPLEGDHEIVADAGQVQQALLAVLVNAVEAMKAGGTLTVRMSGDPGGVLIDVADTGVGIPREILPNIFEPFFSTKDNESGVGLGLAVVYGIVHRHGGSIDVESEPGVGTTFHIRLPRRPPAEPAQEPVATAEPVPAGAGA
jgi:two-component system NtrC family sensor kinase